MPQINIQWQHKTWIQKGNSWHFLWIHLDAQQMQWYEQILAEAKIHEFWYKRTAVDPRTEQNIEVWYWVDLVNMVHRKNEKAGYPMPLRRLRWWSDQQPPWEYEYPNEPKPVTNEQMIVFPRNM